MTEHAISTEQALVLIGDRLGPVPHLRNLVAVIRRENEQLPEDTQIGYVVCSKYSDLALELKRKRDWVRLILVGPGLDGKLDMITRLIGRNVQTVLIMDPEKRPLSEKSEEAKRIAESLREAGNILVEAGEATEDFYGPLVKNFVVDGLTPQLDITSLSPEKRSEMLDKRLELNSAHYSFRYPVKTIEQAVALASAKTIRELVLACTVRRLFKKIDAARIEQFWQHSVATSFLAVLFSLPLEHEARTMKQRDEFNRLGLTEEHERMLRELAICKKLDLDPNADAFTAGLLHDIGKVTMTLCFEESLLLIDPLLESGLKEAEERGELWAESSKSLERSLMSDMDHQIIGGRIARRWGIDPRIQQVITQHHDVTKKSPDLLKLVALADVAANTVCCYPCRTSQHPLPRLLDRVKKKVGDLSGADREKAMEESFQGIDSELETVLRKLEVPDHLWQIVDRQAFFRLCFEVRPQIRKATTGFLRMTTAAVG
jgi:putative nucleotidyltransferase with HDIG domain